MGLESSGKRLIWSCWLTQRRIKLSIISSIYVKSLIISPLLKTLIGPPSEMALVKRNKAMSGLPRGPNSEKRNPVADNHKDDLKYEPLIHSIFCCSVQTYRVINAIFFRKWQLGIASINGATACIERFSIEYSTTFRIFRKPTILD